MSFESYELTMTLTVDDPAQVADLLRLQGVGVEVRVWSQKHAGPGEGRFRVELRASGVSPAAEEFDALKALVSKYA